MRTFLKWLILAPVLVVVLVFCVVNRESITLVFDPFGDAQSGLSLQAPLFLALLVALGLGVVVGGLVTWVGQGRHRRAAKQARAEAARLRAERTDLLVRDRSAA